MSGKSCFVFLFTRVNVFKIIDDEDVGNQKCLKRAICCLWGSEVYGVGKQTLQEKKSLH